MITSQMAAEKLLSKMGTDRFEWSSVAWVGHLFAAVQNILGESDPTIMVMWIRTLLLLVSTDSYQSYHDTITGQTRYTIDPATLTQILSVDKALDVETVERCLDTTLATCHFYSLCCNNLFDNNLWREYDRYQFGHYMRQTGTEDAN